MCSMPTDDDDELSPAAVRQELIQRIKNGEGSSVASDSKFARLFERVRQSEEPAKSSHVRSYELLPSPEVGGYDGNASPPHAVGDSYTGASRIHDGLEIERPRSALHAGDFSLTGSQPPKPPCCQHAREPRKPFSDSHGPSLIGTSPTTPWYMPLRRQTPLSPETEPTTQPSPSPIVPLPPLNARSLSGLLSSPPSAAIPISASSRSRSRSRAPSSRSYSSSFVLTTPTSPLVRETRTDDVEPSPFDLDYPNKTHRRHTSSPQTFHTLTSRNLRNFSTPAQAARQPPSTLRDDTASSRGHQTRRSLTSGLPYAAHSTPHTPTLSASRRSSFLSDASPSLRASMIGSYEESILHGRMSTAPSKPLDFTAQIGVLGKGDCKPKHPPHASVDFPAVYYDYNSGIGRPSRIDNEPSPYVGFIDLERSLPPVEIRKRQRSRRNSPPATEACQMEEPTAHGGSRMPKGSKHRPPAALRAPLGGSYRVPQQGQLQILIKSPSKTAVKLFLVPYDLSGMEAGTKTFIRQRCYSTGPVIENPITSKSCSESSLASSVPSTAAKPSLRYLIQLNMCCPSRGRFFLYKSIHVVFANRVPDNKERLQNEILWPEPRFTPYRVVGETLLGTSTSLSDTGADPVQRRRSYGGPPAASVGFSPIRGYACPARPDETTTTSPIPPVPPVPSEYFGGRRRSLFEAQALQSGGADLEMSDPTSPGTDSQATRRTQGSPQLSLDGVDDTSLNRATLDMFGKRSRDDDRLGGVFGRPGTPEPGEGLLARRLRQLGMENARDQTSDTEAL